MPRIGFVDREDPEHLPVVFLEEAFAAALVPRSGGRADRVGARACGIQRQSIFEIGGGIAAAKLRHLEDLAAVGLGEADDVGGADEALQPRHRLPRIADERLRSAMIAVHRADHEPHELAPPGSVFHWQRPAGEVLVPQLPGDGDEIPRDAFELRPGLGDDTLGIPPHVEDELELHGELLFPEPPLTAGSGEKILFEVLLMAFEGCHDRLGGLPQARELRRIAGEREQVA